MDKKKIKKLEFTKSRIANLNDLEMNSIHGGSTYPCSVIAYTIEKTLESIYSMICEASATCPPDTPSYTKYVVSNPDGTQSCAMNPIYVYGVRP
jgi:natural product precursor